MSFEYWIDIASPMRVDMYAAAQRVLGEEPGTGWAEVHDDDQPPLTQQALVSFLVGTDIIAAAKLYESLCDYNADRVNAAGGYIRMRAVAQGDKTGTVVAQRAPNGVKW